MKKKPLKPLMFVGTGSDVGKSVITAAFCRILKQDGYTPAPYKAQNMSLNSYATPDGYEIGRAQAMQAEACSIDCSTDMNPVLLKPCGQNVSQIVLNGKPVGNQTATEYFNYKNHDFLFKQAHQAFIRLSKKYNPIVLEGAGSISEINLWDRDIVNMRMAVATEAVVYLITDIDRGGVFANVYGSILLLPPEQRKYIKGIIINKFRGELNLFETGKKMLEDLVHLPVVGIIPWFNDIYLDEEDSVSLNQKITYASRTKINIAVILLKHLSNYTDFSKLERTEGVHLYYSDDPNEINKASIIIIPGTKNTISDLQQLYQSKLANTIIMAHHAGVAIYGICGGFQMMGQTISDPQHIEGDIESIQGLGILPIHTTIQTQKTTKQQSFKYLNYLQVCHGYEIHMGTSTSPTPSPLCKLADGTDDGFYLNAKTWGTYLHGIFDNAIVIEHILGQVNSQTVYNIENLVDFKTTQYNKLANLVRTNVDIEFIYRSIK